MGCGRDFCSICNPIKGAGQYCPVCYEKSLEHISGKKPGGKKSEPVSGRLSAISPKSKTGRSRKAEEDAPATEAAMPKEHFAGLGGVKEGAIRKRSTGAGVRAERTLDKARQAVGSAAIRVAKVPGRMLPRTVTFFREHFPLGITDTRRGEGMPQLARAWYKLLPVVLGGTTAWTIVVSRTHRRTGLPTWIIAAAVAIGVVWALGFRFDLPTAMVTVMLTLLSLAMGEVLVHILYRSEVIKKLDVSGPEMASAYYRSFYYKVLVSRMLPSALIAFLIGLWPVPKQICWRGFKRTEKG